MEHEQGALLPHGNHYATLCRVILIISSGVFYEYYHGGMREGRHHITGAAQARKIIILP